MTVFEGTAVDDLFKSACSTLSSERPDSKCPNKDYHQRLLARAVHMANFNLLGCYNYDADPLGLRNVTTSFAQDYLRHLSAHQVVAEHGVTELVKADRVVRCRIFLNGY